MASTLIAPDHVEYIREGPYRQPMLTLRQDQMDAFERYQLNKFEDEMVAHLHTFSPRHWEVIGEQTGREAIRFGIKQAEKYGFTNRGPVRFYIEMMFMFGSFFDTDPQYPWIAEGLKDPESMDQMVRADRLYDVMTKYWDAVAGPKNSFTLAAALKMSHVRADDYVTLDLPLEDSFLRGLQSIYPQKCEYLGEVPIRALLKRTLELADRHGLTSNEELLLLTALTFFFGHEWVRDPLWVWLRERLADTKLSNVAERLAERRARALLCLRYTLAGNEGAA